MFNLNFQRLVALLLPWFLRTITHVSWLNALVQPLVEDWQSFLTWKDEMIYEAYMTGQVINLEMLLNDKFNGGLNAWNWDSTNYVYVPNTPNAIYILDFATALPVVYLWNAIEQRPPLYIYNNAEAHTPPLYLYNQTEYDSQADFVIMVPYAVADVTTNALFVAQVKGWVNKYKMAGARYQIVNY